MDDMALETQRLHILWRIHIKEAFIVHQLHMVDHWRSPFWKSVLFRYKNRPGAINDTFANSMNVITNK